jgi:hypothetical protein
MDKKKTIKSDSWRCNVVYTKEERRDAIKQLNQEIQKQNNWIELLEKKKSLEEQLSAVRVDIIKRCVNSACQQRYRYERRIAELEKPKPKKGKKKRR